MSSLRVFCACEQVQEASGQVLQSKLISQRHQSNGLGYVERNDRFSVFAVGKGCSCAWLLCADSAFLFEVFVGGDSNRSEIKCVNLILNKARCTDLCRRTTRCRRGR